MLYIFQRFTPTPIVCRPGSAQDLHAELQSIGVQRYLFMSDPVIQAPGPLDKVRQALTAVGVEIFGRFWDVPPNCATAAVVRCAEQAKGLAAQRSIALGRSSAMDTAKAANFLICEGGEVLADYSGAQLLTRPAC